MVEDKTKEQLMTQYTGSSVDEAMHELNISAFQNTFFSKNPSTESKITGSQQCLEYLNRMDFLSNRIITKERVIQLDGMSGEEKTILFEDIWDDLKEHGISSLLSAGYSKQADELTWCLNPNVCKLHAKIKKKLRDAINGYKNRKTKTDTSDRGIGVFIKEYQTE